MKKKLLTMLLTTAMVLSTLAGCGSKDAASSSSSSASAGGSGDASSDEVITLKVVDWENDAINDAMQDAFDNVFSVEHPNIKVEIIKGSYSDYGSEILAMITAGEAPDVFQYGFDAAASAYDRGLLFDWADYVAAEPEFIEGFYEGTMEGWQDVDGAVYGLPGLVNCYGVFYNKDILAAAGLSEPTADWTWDDLFDYAQALKDPANGKFGLYALDTAAFNIATMSVSEGGDYYIDRVVDTTTVSVDSQWKEAAQKVQGLIADQAIPQRNYEDTNQLSMFETGEIGMMYYGQWEVDNLIRNYPDLNWGYAPTPKGSVCAATPYDVIGWAAPYNTQYPDAVWELMKFMSSDMYTTVLKATPVAPCAHEKSAQTFYDVMVETGHPDAAEAVKTMMEIEKKTAIRFAGDWSSDADKIWTTEYNNFMDGESGASVDIFDDLSAQITTLISTQ